MKSACLITAAICATRLTALGGSPDQPVIEIPIPAAHDPWAFRIELYGWLTGLDGTTGVGPFVSNIDVPFSDIFDHLDMAAALQFEARNGRWGILADGFYSDLGGSGSTPGPIYDTVELEMKQFLGELAVAYRIYEWPTGSVDLYSGMRYNSLSMDFNGTLEQAGIQTLSETASQRIVSGIVEKAASIVGPKVDAFKAGTAAARTAIETQLTNAIEAEAEGQVKRDLQKQLIRIRRDNELDVRDIASNRIARAVKAERLALASSTARLEVAKLRASVDASLQGTVARAQAQVAKAEQKLASAIDTQLRKRIPLSTSMDKNWVDPIIGVRAQWNFHDKWFLAGKSDVGGFGVGSDIAWTLQGTVGYRFTQDVSAELGYRYLYTDYTDGAFTYDIDQAGIYTGLHLTF